MWQESVGPAIDYLLRFLEIVAWPATVIVALIALRKPISKLMLLIQRVRYKEWDVHFATQLDETEEKITEGAPGEDDVHEAPDRVSELVEISPGAAVLEAWKLLDGAARRKVMELVPEGETFTKPERRPTDYLDYKGALSPRVAEAVRSLRKLRNQAAHASDEQISRQEALRYGQIAARIQRHIEAIVDLPEAKLTQLTFLILALNSAIDSGEYQDIPIDEVYSWIEEKNIIGKLSERIGDGTDLSLYEEGGSWQEFVEFYHERMANLLGGYEGKHRRKWGVEKSGLCLLLAWTNEIVQQGSGWYPDIR